MVVVENSCLFYLRIAIKDLLQTDTTDLEDLGIPQVGVSRGRARASRFKA